MQRFRRLFTLLFILSIFVGVVHEVNHDHHDGKTCEICVLIHSPGLLDEIPTIASIEQFYTPFLSAHIALSFVPFILTCSRSPPIA